MKLLQMLGMLWLLNSCGIQETKPSIPQIVSERLQAQITRMTSLLAWTCDGAAPARRPNIECIVEGDAVSMTGWTLLYGNLGSWSLIEKSIGEDGRPWRNPKRVGGTDMNSFSRDQLLGLLEGSAAHTSDSLKSAMRYIERTGRLCPGDDRCNLTGGVLELVKILLKTPISQAEKTVNDWTIQTEANTVPPGYQAHLVSRKIMLHAHLGTLTTGHAKAAAVLARRFPHSLFLRTAHAVANHKEFLPIAEDLATCMESWESPGNAWIGEEIERGCQKNSYGHEYVSLAKFLLQTKEFL